jgi:hypothetical protein
VSFSEDLSAKVSELRAAAERLYLHELSSDRGISVQDDGDWVPAPGNDGDNFDERLAEEQPRYERFMRDLDDLATRFESYTSLNAHQFTGTLTIVGGEEHASSYDWTVYGQIRTAADAWVTPILGLIAEGQWTGNAAQSYVDDFLTPFNQASELQMACVRELTIAVAAYKEATLQSQDALLRVAGLAIAAFDEERSGPTLENVLSFVSIVASAVDFVLGRAILDAVALGADALSRIASTASNEEQRQPEITVDGDNARQILASAWNALSELERRMGDFDDCLRRGLRRGLNSGDLFDSSEIAVPRPAVADDPASMGHLTILAAPGVPIEENPVVVSIVDLFRAGYINLPNAADLYRQASQTLSGVTIPAEPATLYGSSRGNFDEARDLLAGIFSRTRDALTDSGTTLVHTAQTYDLTDAESAEALRQIGRMVPPTTDAVGFPA